MRRRSPAIYFIILLIALILFVAVDRTLPRQHLPWRSLDPQAPVGFATDMQLFRVALSPSSVCRNMAMETKALLSSDAEPHRPKDPCGWDKAQVFAGTSGIDIAPDETPMQCPLTLASYIWLREADRDAEQIFGSGLARVHHAGSYSCRRQVGNSSGQWSEHAFANAWDINGFELNNGEIISVLKDWDGTRDRKRFLRRTRKNACRIFRVTLSPDFNEAHRDHFHVDMGPTIACR